MASHPDPATVCLDPRVGLDTLVRVLTTDGFRVVGPVERNGGIEYAEVAGGDDLPTGVRVEQAPGRFRLRREGSSRFAFTPGAASWKQFVLPAHQEVVRVRRTDGSFAVTRPQPPSAPLAIIGARDCELRALAILDRVELDPLHPDPRYASRRAGMFVVAVTCSHPADTCWCTSMGGGPQPQADYDILLTEVDTDGAGHRLVAQAGSERGSAVLQRLTGASATPADRQAAADVASAAAGTIAPRGDGASLPQRLAGRDQHPHWDDVAARCLSCGNCTMVCPTCFCSTFEDHTGLTDDGSAAIESVRTQQWASCFQLDHSYLGGHPVRSTTVARYRQWLTHKLQTWPTQFGTAGCVGCGRCSTWCPAGIDLPAEAAALVGDGA
ncbi:MAG TPA: 4Fe-4S dicluster domain-containing protein [Ilumatobacteraceae bacterium]|nr:4Fe-4S dicluster domain-containing protein [Ilumatobacteraceae bacterium]